MTSKEALENIKSRINSLSLFPKVDKKTYDESWEIIEKDLETLEILQNKLAEYEALEKQGRLIKLPCAVGDKIYIVNFPYIATDEIEKININYETRTEIIKEYQIGTYAFFSREAAETLLEHIKECLENEKIKR